jgi:hypothetical protein
VAAHDKYVTLDTIDTPHGKRVVIGIDHPHATPEGMRNKVGIVGMANTQEQADTLVRLLNGWHRLEEGCSTLAMKITAASRPDWSIRRAQALMQARFAVTGMENILDRRDAVILQDALDLDAITLFDRDDFNDLLAERQSSAPTATAARMEEGNLRITMQYAVDATAKLQQAPLIAELARSLVKQIDRVVDYSGRPHAWTISSDPAVSQGLITTAHHLDTAVMTGSSDWPGSGPAYHQAQDALEKFIENTPEHDQGLRR